MDVEVVRILKLTDKGVEKIPFKIPRHDKHKFCEELFPPSAAYESAMDARSYLEGKNANPVLSSVDPSAAAGAKKEETVEEAEQEEVRIHTHTQQKKHHTHIYSSPTHTGPQNLLRRVQQLRQPFQQRGVQVSSRAWKVSAHVGTVLQPAAQYFDHGRVSARGQ